jgi:hypothetical protein
MGFLLFDAIVIAMQSLAPIRALVGPLQRGQLCERSWASSCDHRSRQLLSRVEMTLEVDFAFLMCGLREGRNNVYRTKQMTRCGKQTGCNGLQIGQAARQGLSGYER